jgi:flagellar motor switch protein FliM
MRYGAAVDELSRPSVSAVAAAPELGSQFLVALDGNIARVMLHSMMGGRPSAADTAWKSFTHIDRRISARFMDKLLAAFAEAFAPFAKITPKVETVDVQAQAAAVLPRVTPATVITVEVEMDKEAGRITIVIPRSALDPVRQALENAGAGEGAAEDGWHAGVRSTASGLPLAVEAVLGTTEALLREVLGWKPGTKIVLPPPGQDSTRLVCAGSTVARGRAGQKAGRRAVLVSGHVTGEEAGEPTQNEENPE